ncbi:response regulator transcription factor [Saccharicrinis aurantiacus]|uniref:response regulator transcription factor n=1 Tax=Saccharicrinis aurantiacus TaxID=1849719 RepID=UPI00249037AE|nr:LuxR C-terminal-related transcriptional regulator [Saccharicrinis aurantiacus]
MDILNDQSNEFLFKVLNSLPAMVQILEVDNLNRTLPIWITDNYAQVTGLDLKDRLKLGFAHPEDIYSIKDSEDVIAATKKLLIQHNTEVGVICRVNLYSACNWMYIRLKRIALQEDMIHIICIAFRVDEQFLINNTKLDECISELKRDQNSIDGSLLTKSELIVLKLLVQSLSTKEIAMALNRSFNTVNNHKRSIFKKLKVHKTSELIMFAKEYGI